MPAASLDKEIDALYALPSGEFVAARDELAARLKREGERDESGRVKALRRPTVAAWAVNQLVRRHSSEVDELLAAGDELRKAQRRALSGVASGGSALRQAGDRRRKALRDLVGPAEGLLEEEGHGATGTIDAIQATLEAASTDEETGRIVRQGRLSKELPPPSGFGAVEGLSLVVTPEEEPKELGKATPRKRSRAGEDEAARRAQARAERDHARTEARQSEREAERARKAAQRAAEAAIKAQEEADRAQEAAERTRRRAREMAAAAREAGEAAAKADRQAERTRKAADEAERRLTE
jgi:hypothetical protein